MLQAERRRIILDLVRQNGEVSITNICSQFGVTEMTVRRDLSALDRDGLLRRVHGGAVSALGRSYEPPYLLRSTANLEAKRRIAAKAAELIADGESLALDVGTTTLEVVRQLQNKRNLTILTTSLPIANEVVSHLSLENNVRLILTGGIVRSGELSMIGHIAETACGELHVDKAFIGIGGLSLEDGLTEYNFEDALVKRALLKTALRKIVLADGSKFGRTAFATVAPLSFVDTIITDASAPEELVQGLTRRKIQVILAGEEQPKDESDRSRSRST